MIPRVIIHNGLSLDGRMDWSIGDAGLYYELAERFGADAMISGSNTMITAYAAAGPVEEGVISQEPPAPDPDDHRQILVIVDSRGRIHNLPRIRQEPYWRDVVVLCSHATPGEYLAGMECDRIQYIQVGEDHVDLRAGLEELNVRFGVRTLRVDSGGILNGVLLRQGLVDEISIIVDPCLVGGETPRSVFVAPSLTSQVGVIPLRLIHLEKMRGDIVWLKYEVIKGTGGR